jgi:hypothetical protein
MLKGSLVPHHARSLKILLVSVCLICGVATAQAAGFARVGPVAFWEPLFAGTRSESMGQSDLAVSRGPLSIFANPAPLPEGQAVQAGYGHLAYLAELDFHQYAAAVETGAFRIGLARMDFVSDSKLIRTAYMPEGTGETFRIDDRVMVIAGSMNVAALLAPGSPWDWTVGLAHRNYRFNSPEEVTHVNGLDFGSSGRYRHRWQNTSLIASAAGVLRNIDDTHYVPEDTRLGLGLALAIDTEQSREAIVLTVSYVFKDVRAADEYFGDRYYGAELTLLQALSFRIGRDKQLFGGSSQYGLGLDVPRPWIEPFGVTLDWGVMKTGTLSSIGLTDESAFNMFSVTIRREM